MKTSNKYSGNTLYRPEIEKSNKRTIEDVKIEIQEIINKTELVEMRLAQLKAKGYKIEDCWVKNGSIGTIWYMSRRQVYRIQVTTSEVHGKFPKAYCVVIPFNDLSVQISELAKMRNFSTIERPPKKQKSGILKINLINQSRK
jgi:hypothetical protein